jgi:hypothetical protein
MRSCPGKVTCIGRLRSRWVRGATAGLGAGHGGYIDISVCYSLPITFFALTALAWASPWERTKGGGHGGCCVDRSVGRALSVRRPDIRDPAASEVGERNAQPVVDGHIGAELRGGQGADLQEGADWVRWSRGEQPRLCRFKVSALAERRHPLRVYPALERVGIVRTRQGTVALSDQMILTQELLRFRSRGVVVEPWIPDDEPQISSISRTWNGAQQERPVVVAVNGIYSALVDITRQPTESLRLRAQKDGDALVDLLGGL